MNFRTSSQDPRHSRKRSRHSKMRLAAICLLISMSGRSVSATGGNPLTSDEVYEEGIELFDSQSENPEPIYVMFGDEHRVHRFEYRKICIRTRMKVHHFEATIDEIPYTLTHLGRPHKRRFRILIYRDGVQIFGAGSMRCGGQRLSVYGRREEPNQRDKTIGVFGKADSIQRLWTSEQNYDYVILSHKVIKWIHDHQEDEILQDAGSLRGVLEYLEKEKSCIHEATKGLQERRLSRRGLKATLDFSHCPSVVHILELIKELEKEDTKARLAAADASSKDASDEKRPE